MCQITDSWIVHFDLTEKLLFVNSAEFVEMTAFETKHLFDEKNIEFVFISPEHNYVGRLWYCSFIESYYSRPIQQLVTHTNILPKLFVSNCLQTVVFLCVNLINKNIQGQSWWSLKVLKMTLCIQKIIKLPIKFF